MAVSHLPEASLFRSQLLSEENKLRDPYDVYLSAREREAERVRQGLPPRHHFLKERHSVNKLPGKNERRSQG